MPVIKIYKTMATTDHESVSVSRSKKLSSWIFERYGPIFDNDKKCIIDVKLNGSFLKLLYDHPELSDSMFFDIGDNRIEIYERQFGNAVQNIVAPALSITKRVFNEVVSLFTPDIKLPSDAGVQAQSPNNQVSGQTNIYRTGQSKPYIYGQDISYPDLLGEPVGEYIDNRRQVTQQFLVSVGDGTVEDMRLGSVPFENIAGAQVEQYGPYETIPDDTLVGFAVENADGIDLIAPNLVETGDSASSTNASNFLDNEDEFSFDVPQTSDWDTLANKDIGTFFQLTYFIQGVETIGYGTLFSAELSGGTYTFTFNNFFGEVGSVYGTDVTAQEQEQNVFGPYYTLEEVDYIWFDFEFSRGLKNLVRVRGQIVKIDGPTGDEIANSEQDIVFTFSDADTFEAQYDTRKVTLTAGRGYYKIVGIRQETDSADNSNEPDLCTLERITGLKNIDAENYGNITWIKTVLTSSPISAATRENKFNCLFSRSQRSIDNYLDGTGNEYRTNGGFADSVLQIFLDYNKELNDSTIDAETLRDIQDSVPSANRFFRYTFDNANTPFTERVITCCDAVRTKAYRDGSMWSFFYDGAQETNRFLISKNNIAYESQRQLNQVLAPIKTESSYSAVSIEYRDIDNLNQQEFIYATFDTETLEVTEITRDESLQFRTLKLKIAGIKEYDQALDRLKLEVRRLVYQQQTLRETTLNDGQGISLGDVGYWTDPYSEFLFAGEIIAYDESTNIATTSDRLEIDESGDYFVIITDEYGNTYDAVSVLSVTDEIFQFEADLSTVFIANGDSIQQGTRYTIGKTSDLDRTRWQVISKVPNLDSEGNLLVTLEMLPYYDELYADDE